MSVSGNVRRNCHLKSGNESRVEMVFKYSVLPTAFKIFVKGKETESLHIASIVHLTDCLDSFYSKNIFFFMFVVSSGRDFNNATNFVLVTEM